MFKSVRKSVTDDECMCHLTTLWMVDNLNELMLWFKRTGMDLHIPSSMWTSGNMKFVQGGCQNSLQMSTNGHAIFAVISWRRGFPAMDCHRPGNMGALPLWTCKQMSKHGAEIHINQDQEIQKFALLAAKWCWHCFQTSLGPSLSTTRIMDRWSIVYSTVLCLPRGDETCYLQYMQRNADKGSCSASCCSSNCWNNLKTEIQASPPPSIQSRSHPIQLPYFQTAKRCIMWMQICKQWRGHGCGEHMASRASENILCRWHQKGSGLK